MMQIARQAQLLLCRRDKGVSLWRILKKPPVTQLGMQSDDVTEQGGYVKVLDMELNTTTNLVASAISDDGRWLAVSDLYESKLFALQDVVSTHVALHSINNSCGIHRVATCDRNV